MACRNRVGQCRPSATGDTTLASYFSNDQSGTQLDICSSRRIFLLGHETATLPRTLSASPPGVKGITLGPGVTEAVCRPSRKQLDRERNRDRSVKSMEMRPTRLCLKGQCSYELGQTCVSRTLADAGLMSCKAVAPPASPCPS